MKDINNNDIINPGSLNKEDKPSSELSRRSFLKIMGGSIAYMAVTGCRRPLEEIVPYVEAPEEAILGNPEKYATSMTLGMGVYGLVVTSFEGRPTKIEGNALHSSSRGGSNAFMQAEILNLYDPDRLKKCYKGNTINSWDGFKQDWSEIHEKYTENQGEGLAILSQSFCSPTLFRQYEAYKKAFPKATWTVFDPVSDENIFKGLSLATGKSLRPNYKFEKAKVILSLDSDFLHLGADNVAAARGFADGRQVNSTHDKMNRLYTVESNVTLTGAMADHRIRLKSSEVFAFSLAIAGELSRLGLNTNGLDDRNLNSKCSVDGKVIKAIAEDLLSNKGQSVIIAGSTQPSELHALVVVLNDLLGNTGKTVTYNKITDAVTANLNELNSLKADLTNKSIETLVILGGDPAFNFPVDYNLKALCKDVKNVIFLGNHKNSTSEFCSWTIPQNHFLESWGDARSSDGTLSIVQPLIAPLYKGHSTIELMNIILTGEERTGYELSRETWAGIFGLLDSESKWKEVLHEGFYNSPQSLEVTFSIDATSIEKSVGKYLSDYKPIQSDLELTFSADPSVYDGRYANNGWLQEAPDPITKINWTNVAGISPGTADKNSLVNGDVVEIKNGKYALNIPVWIIPGLAENSLALTLGNGNKKLGRISELSGYSSYTIRTSESTNICTVRMTRTSENLVIPTTQKHPYVEDRPLIRETELKEYQKHPEFAQDMVHVPDTQSLWEEHQYDEGNQWGMTIDLNLCIGCNSCVLACQSENNVPIVGSKPSNYGREMHWLRIDRYFSKDEENPTVRFQPVACQHCEMAPCESVCPVAATNHDQEGLNLMVYNRCVGTRYCANNCPYKVRRFNFYNYTNEYPEIVKMSQNPDVTVRSRGVMEKCSYCLHRINRIKRDTKLSGSKVQDGAVVTACQQACPTGAIQFGNINDPDSKVVAAKKVRNYELLAEFNTRPRTSYQAKIRNPNPDLKKLI